MAQAKVRLVCDSTADLDPDFAKQHNIIVVPLKVIFGDETFDDGVQITSTAFYERIRNSSIFPRTSQPTPGNFEDAFRRASVDDVAIICTTISSELSGTYGAAIHARTNCPELGVSIFDTGTASLGHNAIVHAAIRAIEGGADSHEVIRLITEIKRAQRTLFTLESLEYLKRGGRIGGASALVGSMLNIKPVLEIKEGWVEVYEKVRTYKKALGRMVEEVVAAAHNIKHSLQIIVCHSERPGEAQQLATDLAPWGAEAIPVIEIGTVIGCHGGPGVLGVSYYPATIWAQHAPRKQLSSSYNSADG